VDQAYRRAKDVLVKNQAVLDRIAAQLIEKETVDAGELQDILNTSQVVMAPIA
jgi:cell division protease FtsH